MKHSSTRLSAIHSMINDNKGRINREGIKDFLGQSTLKAHVRTTIPSGLEHCIPVCSI